MELHPPHHLDIYSPPCAVEVLSFLPTGADHVDLCHCDHPRHRYLPIAPKGCTLAVEWDTDRKDVPGGHLKRKVNSFWNLAIEIAGRVEMVKGGTVHGVRSLGRSPTHIP